MGFLEKAKELLIKHEGLKLKVYRCTAEKLTIGVGRNIEDNKFSREEIGVLFPGENLDQKTAELRVVKNGINRLQSMYLLDNDLNAVVKDLRIIFREFDEYPENVKLALASMRFNLGPAGFRKFKRMIANVKAGEYKVAADEITSSKYAKQVPNRAKDIMRLLKSAGRIE